MATLPDPTNVNYPTPDEVLSTMLAHVRFLYASVGVTVNAEKLRSSTSASRRLPDLSHKPSATESLGFATPTRRRLSARR